MNSDSSKEFQELLSQARAEGQKVGIKKAQLKSAIAKVTG